MKESMKVIYSDIIINFIYLGSVSVFRRGWLIIFLEFRTP